MRPEVSVCIPTYNYGRYLAQAIESVLGQSYTDFELIIVDDCSSDNTEEIINEYAARDSRIVSFFNSKNLGMVQNWNKCLSLAKGEYVKYLFGDDLFCSKYAIERMLKILKADCSVSLVASARYIIDDYSNQIDLRSNFKSGVKDGKEVINKCIFDQTNYIGEPSVVMFRKNQAVRGFDERYKQIVDIEMWFHLLEQGNFAYIDRPMCSFRHHSEQQTNKNSKSMVIINDLEMLYAEYLGKAYIVLNKIYINYLKYDYYYQIWKSYFKKHLITKKQAYDKICNKYTTLSFLMTIPLYKMCKKYLKYKKMSPSTFPPNLAELP